MWSLEPGVHTRNLAGQPFFPRYYLSPRLAYSVFQGDPKSRRPGGSVIWSYTSEFASRAQYAYFVCLHLPIGQPGVGDMHYCPVSSFSKNFCRSLNFLGIFRSHVPLSHFLVCPHSPTGLCTNLSQSASPGQPRPTWRPRLAGCVVCIGCFLQPSSSLVALALPPTAQIRVPKT